MKRHIYSLLAGALFAIGLGVSGMTQPSKVRGFLDFFGEWDLTLLFVLGPAVGIYFLGTRIAKKALPERFEANPPPSRITPSFVVGSICFGIGWGLVGFCPGPAVVSLGQGSWQSLFFFGFLALGIFVSDRLLSRFAD